VRGAAAPASASKAQIVSKWRNKTTNASIRMQRRASRCEQRNAKARNDPTVLGAAAHPAVRERHSGQNVSVSNDATNSANTEDQPKSHNPSNSRAAAYSHPVTSSGTFQVATTHGSPRPRRCATSHSSHSSHPKFGNNASTHDDDSAQFPIQCAITHQTSTSPSQIPDRPNDFAFQPQPVKPRHHASGCHNRCRPYNGRAATAGTSKNPTEHKAGGCKRLLCPAATAGQPASEEMTCQVARLIASTIHASTGLWQRTCQVGRTRDPTVRYHGRRRQLRRQLERSKTQL